MSIRILASLLLVPGLACAQSLPSPRYSNLTTTGATLQTEDRTTSVRVSLAAPISLGRTWLGQTNYPVPGLARIPDGHLSIQGSTRGWGVGASVFQAIANGPQGVNSCEGAMNCYIDPGNRGYAGQDGVAATMFAYSRTPLALRVAVSSIRSVTLANGTAAVQLTLAQALPTAASVVPLMKVETTPGPGTLDYLQSYYGYTIAPAVLSGGQAVLPISADGKTLTLDGLYNANRQALTTAPAGMIVDIDVLHQVDALYAGAFIKDGDGIRDAHVIEGIPLNNRTGPTTWSTYDPLGDSVDLNGIFMPIDTDIPGGNGTGSSAFLASSGGVGTWKRGFSCRNQPTTNSGVTDCLVNAFATNGLHSVANRTNGGLTNNALLVQPNDLGGTTTALITQAGDASFRSITSAGPMQITGQATLTNLNASLQPFNRSSLPASGCTPGNIVFVQDGRNVPLDGASGPVSGVPAFCNAAHQWIAMTGGQPVSN